MTTIVGGVESSGVKVLIPGFAKLQGEDSAYYMWKYSITLGRNSKNSSVDVDLVNFGGGKAVSRRHARIYYDFTRECFALEVIGKKGCTINNVLYLPGSAPIKLKSQDFIQIGRVRFYFLLPTRSISETLAAAMQTEPPLPPPLVVVPPPCSNYEMKAEETEDDGVSMVEKFKAGEVEGLSGVLCRGSSSNIKLEPGATSGKEGDNQLETPDVHVVKANFPGIKKEHIKLEAEGNNVWIQIGGEHTVENEGKTDMSHHGEDSSGKFLWRFVLPEHANADETKVTMENGVLTVTVPKGKVEEVKEPATPGVERIEISGDEWDDCEMVLLLCCERELNYLTSTLSVF